MKPELERLLEKVESGSPDDLVTYYEAELIKKLGEILQSGDWKLFVECCGNI